MSWRSLLFVRSQSHVFSMNSILHPSASFYNTRTINVEYNQLDPLLRASGSGEGDVNDSTGFSPYPGNINQLLFRLDAYVKVLERTKGVMVSSSTTCSVLIPHFLTILTSPSTTLQPEFVNPKYKDAEKTVFKKPTRLECMMQVSLALIKSFIHRKLTTHHFLSPLLKGLSHSTSRFRS